MDLAATSGLFSTASALGCSADGSVVVGVGDTQAGERAFRWTHTTGMQSLGVVGGLAIPSPDC